MTPHEAIAGQLMVTAYHPDHSGVTQREAAGAYATVVLAILDEAGFAVVPKNPPSLTIAGPTSGEQKRHPTPEERLALTAEAMTAVLLRIEVLMQNKNTTGMPSGFVDFPRK